MQVWSLGQEGLEEGMATHSSILAWRIPWTEEPGRLQFIRLQSWTQLKWHSMHAYYITLYDILYLPFREILKAILTWKSSKVHHLDKLSVFITSFPMLKSQMIKLKRPFSFFWHWIGVINTYRAFHSYGIYNMLVNGK